MPEEQEEKQVYPCHKCGASIDGMLYVLMLPTQLRRPTEEDASRTETTRFQFCGPCLARYAYEYLTNRGVEQFLLESESWEHPTGSDEVVWICGDEQLPTLTKKAA